MDKISHSKKILSAVLLLSVMSACSDASSYDVRTPLSSTGVSLEGLGVELDPHFIAQNVT